jgi:hypothetical protein
MADLKKLTTEELLRMQGIPDWDEAPVREEIRRRLEQADQTRAENQRARVQVPLWRGVAAAMVQRAKRIKCQYGGDHSIADCRCDPYQLGDAVASMQDELDAVVALRAIESTKKGGDSHVADSTSAGDHRRNE